MRIPVEVVGGERGAPGRRLCGLVYGGTPACAGQGGDRLLQLRADGADGGEMGRRALRDQADQPAPYRPGERPLVGAEQFQLTEPGLAPGPRVARQQPEQRGGQHGLAAAALPDQHQALTGRDLEVHVGHGGDTASAGHQEADGEAAHGQDGGALRGGGGSGRDRLGPRSDPAVTASAPIGGGG